ncbi:MAG: AAA family ATPase [Chitinophagales bacterium]|nr:AAA family ATPase [Chitinophagales bacterium]
MVTEIKIRNFKSVKKLDFSLGKFNVFIGENGCGKSNILEAIAFGAAASADKLDNEFLSSRGIRVTDSRLFRSAFDKNFETSIELGFKSENGQSKELNFELQHSNEFNGKWIELNKERNLIKINDVVKGLMDGKKPDSLSITEWAEVQAEVASNREIDSLFKVLRQVPSLKEHVKFDEISIIFEKKLKEDRIDSYLSNFKIFSPENSVLRDSPRLEKSADPLSIHGEGLFELLQEYSLNDIDAINTIKEGLNLIDWFDDFEIIPSEGRKLIRIKDRFLDKSLDFIPQNNTNEGFLFLLFYLALYISKDTPRFFAIDNIEASFHPILCKKLTKVLVEFSKQKEGKQSIVTTHNPFVLDGLDLSDPDQRLFVVYRNRNGETKLQRVEHAERSYELSHGWMNGFLGGVPSHLTS